MSQEVFGDEGNTCDEGSYNAGRDAMREDVIDLIDKERDVLKKDLAETERMLVEEKTPERWEAYTRLNQAIQALNTIEAGMG
jgi:hypothetical protein